MKVITCVPLPPPHGGITNWYRILQAEAADHGYTFLNIDTSPGKSIAGRSIFYRLFVQGFRMLGQYRELYAAIRKNPDAKAAHITTSGSLALVRDILFLRLLKRKQILSVYHIHFGRIPEIFEKKGLEYKLLTKALGLASVTIAIDPKTYDTLRTYSGEEGVCYVPNPVKKTEENKAERKKTILFLGNVLFSKGVEELLRAWSRLAKKYPDWTLSVVGFCEEAYRHHLEQHFPLQNVEFLGYMPHGEAMEKLEESAFLVLPSHTEGFPNVILEAMMRGKAVLATDIGAIADMLSGDCGIVIPPHDADALYGHLESMIVDEEKRQEMGVRGREKACTEYASDIIFEKYAALWKGQ